MRVPQHISTWLIVVLAAGLLTLAAVLLNPSPDLISAGKNYHKQERFETTQWLKHSHPVASFEYPIGWKVTELKGGFRIEDPMSSGSFIQIFYGKIDEVKTTNICYSHYPPDFTYWDFNRSERRASITTADGIKLRKWVATGEERYYVCEANKKISFEGVTYGRISEDLFDHMVQTFHFAPLEPKEE